MRHHVELRRQQLIDDGIDPRAAEREAKRMFGNEARIREQARDVWSIRWLDTLAQDARYGARLLWRAPEFTALSVASLTVGIGSAAAVFSVADAALLRPLSVRAPHELRQLQVTLSVGPLSKVMGGVDLPVLIEMQRAADFASVVGFRVVDDVAIAAEMTAPRTVRAELVSGNYFEVLGVPAVAGRTLGKSDQTGSPAIAISERLWRKAFDADPAINGRSISLNGTPAVIVGVVRTFRGLAADRPADVFVPLAAAAIFDPPGVSPSVRVALRLGRDVPLAVAEQKARALYVGAAPSMARGNDLKVELLPAGRGVSDSRAALEQPLQIGLVFAAVLLLAACANTGGLLVARFAARQGEFAVRLAIGAGRTRIVRQLIVESMLLAALAAAAGLVIAFLTGPLLLRSIPIGAVAPDFELRFDYRLVAFTAAAAATAALVAAAASLWRLLGSNPAGMLTIGARTVVPGRRRLNRSLIAAQVACSLLLLVGAGSMTRSLANLRAVKPGFETSGTFMLSADAAGLVPTEQRAAYFGRLLERLASAPHVQRVSLLQFPLMSAAATTGNVTLTGFSPASDDDRWTRMFFVGPQFFETLGMRVVAGRDILAQDTSRSERVAVVNQEFARHYFGGTDLALGRVVNSDVRIVGVAADAQYNTLRDAPVRAMFLPYAQAPSRPSMTFLVGAAGDIRGAMTSAMDAARRHDPQLKLRVTTLEDQVASTLSRERFVAALASGLSGLALFLSCAGLYGAVAYAASERRHELAVRLALGATRGDLVRMMVSDPLKVAAVGIAAGVPVVYAVMRGLSALLYGISPFDAVTLAACAGGLLVVAAAAAFWPARRASAIAPVECLKCR
jgi:predicted permease